MIELVKICIFNLDVLDIIGEALDDNDIPYASLGNTNQSHFKRNIQKFKVCHFIFLNNKSPI